MATSSKTTPQTPFPQHQQPSSDPQPQSAKRPKTGGRTKGTSNRVTSMTKDIINQLLGDYQESGLMATDFAALEPKDRLTIAEKLMQYTMPKMQSTAVDLTAKDSTSITIEQRLRDLSKPDHNL